MALYERLIHSSDSQLAAIAAKAIKEARYHLRFSRGWLVRLGGRNRNLRTKKCRQAVDSLWRLTAELFDADDVELALIDDGVAVDPRDLRGPVGARSVRWPGGSLPPRARRSGVSHGRQEGLRIPNTSGPMLAEMQYLQRVLPRPAVVREDASVTPRRHRAAQIPADLGAIKPDPRPEVRR